MGSSYLRLTIAMTLSTVTLNGCAAKFRAINSSGLKADANSESGEANGKGVVSLDLRQEERDLKIDLLKQGASGDDKSQNFAQTAGAGVLDILVVVDNSGSMIEEQANLATKLAPLLDSVKNSDWQIGVVTTDADKATVLRDIIKKSDADAANKYRVAVSAGANGSGVERGIEMAERGLNPAMAWVRPSSTLATLIVSDEDNCSQGSTFGNAALGGCKPQPYLYNPAHFLDFLKNTMKRTPGKDARIYGIIYRPGDTAATCPTGYNVSNDYAKLVTDTGGMSGSICDADYTAVLKKISDNIAEILKNQFALTETPSPGSVVVTIDGTVLPPAEYSVSGNVITFAKAPAVGAKVVVSYKTGAGEQLTTFELADLPAADGAIEVRVGSSVVPPSGYSIDFAARTITFNKAPPSGAEIKISYRIDGSATLKSDFAIGKGIAEDTLKVKVDGVVVTNYSYDSASGVLHFDTPPADGASINVEFSGEGVTKFAPPARVP